MLAAKHGSRTGCRARLDNARRRTYFFAMRLTSLRRIVAGLAALALVLTLGWQGMHAAAMASMQTDRVTADATDASGNGCPLCNDPGTNAAMQCQPICGASVAILPIAGAAASVSLPERFEAQNLICFGRTGAPEPHPPKAAGLA